MFVPLGKTYIFAAKKVGQSKKADDEKTLQYIVKNPPPPLSF